MKSPSRPQSIPLKHWRPGRGLVASLCALLLLVWVHPALGQADHGAGLPQLGDGSELSTSQERQIGDRIMRDLYRDPSYLDDPVILDYLEGLWQPLLASARKRGELTPEIDERFAWQISLIRDRSVNAFALPGGYLGVHLGLLATVASRDELASVLGHELSHVTQRHIARMLSKNKQQAPWVVAAMVLGALAASKSADAANALVVGGQALGIQGQLNFSRDMEREADRIGFGVATQAGYQAQGFVDMFDKLQQAARLNDTGAFPYLRTHPLSTERIADMQARIPMGQASGVTVKGSVTDAFMAARARVLMSADAALLTPWQALIGDRAFGSKPLVQQLGGYYGGALAAMKARQMDLARQYLGELKARAALAGAASMDEKAHSYLLWLGAEIDLEAKDLSADALEALSRGLAQHSQAATPKSRAQMLLEAQLALQLATPQALRRASQDLQLQVMRNTSDALSWQLLSQLHTAMNMPMRALRDAAEAQAAQFNYSAALDRLRAAQEQSRRLGAAATPAEQIESSIIDTRFRQISALARSQAQER